MADRLRQAAAIDFSRNEYVKMTCNWEKQFSTTTKLMRAKGRRRTTFRDVELRDGEGGGRGLAVVNVDRGRERAAAAARTCGGGTAKRSSHGRRNSRRDGGGRWRPRISFVSPGRGDAQWQFCDFAYNWRTSRNLSCSCSVQLSREEGSRPRPDARRARARRRRGRARAQLSGGRSGARMADVRLARARRRQCRASRSRLSFFSVTT
uniref:Uncharacterized protein n=1 Tax=Oryza meridionalis TaxID=40149 RepID=A0A0E0E4A6_9ORYZ